MVFVWTAYPTEGSLSPFLNAHPQWFQNSLGTIYEGLATVFIDFTHRFQAIFEWFSDFNILLVLLSMLLLTICAYYLSAEKRRDMDVSFKSVLVFVVSYSLLWWFLGSGIPWYVFPVLGVLPLVILYFWEYPEGFMGLSNIKFSI